MMVQKDPKKNDGSWEVYFYYQESLTGKRKRKHKTGFATKKQAIEWANSFLDRQNPKCDMKFKDFYQIYLEDQKVRLRESTVRTKEYIVELKILPYFGERKLNEITPGDIRQWHQVLMKAEFDKDMHAGEAEGSMSGIKDKYSPTYLKTIHNQLSAIFNYAVQYYDLSRNPCKVAGGIGKDNADEMQFWTQEEFETFLEFVSDKPVSRTAFNVLFWGGLRIGELLALTLADVDFEEKTIRINKSYQRIRSKDVITEPKTEKSKRIITIPDFLVEELQGYVGMLYGIMETDRLFNITKSYLEHEMKRGCELSGVKKIRLHDLRHSHASLLISKLGAQPLQVAERLGHERIQTTLNTYSHLYPNQGRELADKLDKLKFDEEDE